MISHKRIFGLFGLVLLLAPLVVATVPVAAIVEDDSEPYGWWTETTVDRNQNKIGDMVELHIDCLLYTSPSPRDESTSRMPSSA